MHRRGKTFRARKYQGDDTLCDEMNGLSEMLASLPWRHAVFASSGSVYEAVSSGIRLDEASALAKSPYALSKLASERHFISNGGTVLRLTNLIGEGMSDETIVGDIMKMAMLDHNVGQASPDGSDKQSVSIRLRDCSAVLDLLGVEAAAAAFRKVLISPEAMGRTLNIGSGRAVTARKLIQIIICRLGKRLRTAISTTDEKNLGIVLDTRLAENFLGWRPEVTLEAALATFIPDKSDS